MMLKIYQIGVNLIALTLLSVFPLGCKGNPSHSLPIEGSVDIKVTSEGIICFIPDLNSATFVGKPYEGLEGITDVYIIINTWDAHYKDEFSVISDKSKTCITNNNFESTPYDQLIHGNSYNLYLSGLTADGVYHADFTGKFYYP